MERRRSKRLKHNNDDDNNRQSFVSSFLKRRNNLKQGRDVIMSTTSSTTTTPSSSIERNIIIIIPDDIWKTVFSFASNRDLASVIPCVCQDFQRICSAADEYLWKPRCLELWQDKAECAWKPFMDNATLSYCQKYQCSLKDSQRTELTVDELCNFTWAFRFKPSAGDWWTIIDPYWSRNDGTYMTRGFRHDGTLYNPGPIDELERYAMESNLEMKWRFTKTRRSPETGIVRGGNFLQVNRWPSSGIERSSQDWSWIMQNQWVVYAYPPDNIFNTMELDGDLERWI